MDNAKTLCKFCRSDIDLDGSHTKKLRSRSLGLGKIRDFIFADVWYLTDANETNPRVCMDITDAHSRSITTASFPINYCPICGRKLRQILVGFVDYTNAGDNHEK